MVDVKPRLLIFDILRITSVLAVILYHVAPRWGVDARMNFPPLWYFQINFGYVAVWLLIFVSGAVLEYGNYKLDTPKDVISFYWRRLSKLYPAYWLTIALAIFLTPSLLQLLVAQPFMQLSGLSVMIGDGENIIFVAWFVGVIASLYLLFPLLSKLIYRSPYFWTGTVSAISLFSVWLIFNDYILRPSYGVHFYRYFPVCCLFAFVAGVFIVNRGWYPKTIYTNETLAYFAELSFYAILTHGIIKYNIHTFSVLESILVYFSVLVVISSVIMMFDTNIRRIISDLYSQTLN